ncbi:MAG: hypothetical protein H6739_11750 [Alphaproteobacteria bacterium]|nr:hypothetical protein [Alphaproteobacteria bacterium]
MRAAVLLIAVALLPSGGLAPVPAEPPEGFTASSADCARCHRRVARQWQGSGHAGAFADVDFQAAWQPWPNGWCVNCHLPLEAAQQEALGDDARPGAFYTDAHADGPLAAEGVGCPACHVREGAVLTPGLPSASGLRAHPMRQEPALGTADFCGGCHDFPFQNHTPAGPFTLSAEPLQDTLDEWRGAPAAAEGVPCQGCHMPRGAHRFPGGHDTGFVREALSIEVTALSSSETRVTLASHGVGHRLPTGDPFRYLEVALLDAEGQPVGAAVFTRRFERTEASWVLIDDTTVPPEGARTLVAQTDAAPARWRLRMVYADPHLRDALPPERYAAVLDEGVVGSPHPEVP